MDERNALHVIQVWGFRDPTHPIEVLLTSAQMVGNLGAHLIPCTTSSCSGI